MGKKKQERKNEFFIRCPLYTQKLEECPSSSNILMKSDFDNLTKKCLSDKYRACKIYELEKEKSQAA
jgi:hypothetical protein